jgi:glycosyltransferase involved in cell wall biosynthesis
MPATHTLKAAVVGLDRAPAAGRQQAPPRPWWWEQVKKDEGLCDLDVRTFSFKGKLSKEISGAELPLFLLKMLPFTWRLRTFDYVFTFECSLTSFGIAFWQTLFFMRRPRHVILQFIMREKTASLSSRLKYACMKWCFSSMRVAVCSASAEARYYREAFGWPETKAAYVPMHTSADLVLPPPADGADDGTVFAAGRTFRDFPTFLDAVRDSTHATVIVASRQAVKGLELTPNVRLYEELAFAEYRSLLERAGIVVVPLKPVLISAGQLVILHAMAAGKAIVATRTPGTLDYIEDGVTGLLVSPGNAGELRQAIDRLSGDAGLRRRLGTAAREAVLAHYLPHHYSQRVRRVLTELAAKERRP